MRRRTDYMKYFRILKWEPDTRTVLGHTQYRAKRLDKTTQWRNSWKEVVMDITEPSR